MLSVSGSLSGVQSSLQSALDLVKFCLVVALPHPRFFGILILLSFTVTLPNLLIGIFILLDIVTSPNYFNITGISVCLLRCLVLLLLCLDLSQTGGSQGERRL